MVRLSRGFHGLALFLAAIPLLIGIGVSFFVIRSRRSPISSSRWLEAANRPSWLSRESLRRSAFRKGEELAGPGRMTELLKSLHFDLADAFAGQSERLADLFQRVVGHSNSEPHP
jgi:hypothetical protein